MKPHPFVRFLLALALICIGGAFAPLASAIFGGNGSGLACFAIPLAMIAGVLAWRVLATVIGLLRMARGKEARSHAPGALVLVPFGPLGGLVAALLLGASPELLIALSLGGLALSGTAYLLARLGWIDPDLGERGEP